MQNSETILVAPLNWGLGHATRCVPVINKHLKAGRRIIIAADGAPLSFLKSVFPQLSTINLPGYIVRYKKKPLFLLSLLMQMPLFYLSIKKEHRKLKHLIKKHNITMVISDNRYGLWNQQIKSIIITHQIYIPLPKGLKPLTCMLQKTTRKWIENFNECWVPDYQEVEQSLSGKLSHGAALPRNVKYIGPLSRFLLYENIENPPSNIYDVLILISGPEPLRSVFEEFMEQRFANSPKKVLMVCGKPGLMARENTPVPNITKIGHLDTPELQNQLLHAKHIIARSGYSTIMDLHALRLKAELIPTPGQLEQEYLYTLHNKP